MTNYAWEIRLSDDRTLVEVYLNGDRIYQEAAPSTFPIRFMVVGQGDLHDFVWQTGIYKLKSLGMGYCHKPKYVGLVVRVGQTAASFQSAIAKYGSIDGYMTPAECVEIVVKDERCGKRFTVHQQAGDWRCMCDPAGDVCPEEWIYGRKQVTGWSNGDASGFGAAITVPGHAYYEVEKVTLAPTPPPTPAPTPAPTPDPTPHPTPAPRPSEPTDIIVTGQLKLTVDDPVAFCEDNAKMLAIEIGIADAAGVEADRVEAECGSDRQRVLYRAGSMTGSMTGSIVVDYTIALALEKVAAEPTWAEGLLETLETTGGDAVAKQLEKYSSPGESVSVDSVSAEEQETGSLTLTTPPPDDGALDGKSADEEETKKGKKKKKKTKMSCFSGDAVVEVMGRGDVPLSDLQTGDVVLAKRDTHEAVLGFMHSIASQPTESLIVVHSHGHFSASPGHIVFSNDVDMLLASIEIGDEISVAGGKAVVLSVRRSIGFHGMFAPLTSSGTIIVDGVLASNYAGPKTGFSSPHGAAHAIAFPARMYYGFQHALGYSKTESHEQASIEVFHPFMHALFGPLSELQGWLLA